MSYAREVILREDPEYECQLFFARLKLQKFLNALRRRGVKTLQDLKKVLDAKDALENAEIPAAAIRQLQSKLREKLEARRVLCDREKFGKGDAVKRVVNRVPVDGKFEVIGFGKSGEYELKWVMRLLSCFACSAAPLPPASRCSSALRPKPRASCASSLTKSLGVPAQSCFGRSVICAGGDLARRPGI